MCTKFKRLESQVNQKSLEQENQRAYTRWPKSADQNSQPTSEGDEPEN